MTRLILASASPRRRELIALLGLSFMTVPTDIDETPHSGESPIEYACRLSREKAQSAARQFPDGLIVGCDTVVADGDTILGKPASAKEAAAVLRRLRGKVHYVFTGVTLLEVTSGRTLTETAASPVRMRDYTDQQIEAYIASGDPFDKAGAYAIQHREFQPVEGFNHCYANVMGLPLCHITRMLRQWGIGPSGDVPSACQQHIQYQCPVYESILSATSNRNF